MYIFGGTVDNNIRSGEMYRFQVGLPACRGGATSQLTLQWGQPGCMAPGTETTAQWVGWGLSQSSQSWGCARWDSGLSEESGSWDGASRLRAV